VAAPERYGDAAWFAVEDDGVPVGVAMLTPPFRLALTPMPEHALAALVAVLVDRLPDLPGVGGRLDIAARFAQLWRERTGTDVEPAVELRVYRLDALVAPRPAPGSLRPAADGDRPRLLEWLDAFVAETGGIGGNTAAALDRWLAQGGLHLWDDGTAVTMAGAAPAVAGVVRIGPVYTPPEVRGCGYASNCVATLSQQQLDAGAAACMLFTDQANPTPNAIYQRLGYREVASAVEYRFTRA
jgi:predicted GNAT family acetyltransferase